MCLSVLCPCLVVNYWEVFFFFKLHSDSINEISGNPSKWSEQEPGEWGHIFTAQAYSRIHTEHVSRSFQPGRACGQALSAGLGLCRVRQIVGMPG